ncbi:hypothetical protein SBA4_910018 [Candidatus Sulfopaludibacter sp. SbA4]|nr:hypothetical protein SBA4_910018 [Candidatus Sulfopaludibacter sp. SbA4]
MAARRSVPFSGDPAKLLDDILTDIARIERFTQGVDRTIFEGDEQVAYAVKYALLRISEAAHRLGGSAAELCPSVEWRDIRGWATGCAIHTTVLISASSGLSSKRTWLR